MVTMLFDLIVVLAWPLVLSAAIWLITIHALADKDDISKVVEALTQPKDVETRATRNDVSRRRTRHTARNLAAAKGRAMSSNTSSGEDRTRNRASLGAVALPRDPRVRAAMTATATLKAPAGLQTPLCILFAAGLIATAAPPAHAERFEFDQRRTEVRFTYVMGLATQRGRFSRVEGDLQFDEHAPQNAQVFAKVATASLETGQPIIDDELKGVNFFNTKAEPVLTFRSRSVKPTAEGSAEMTGDITVNGITKPVTLDVKLQAHDDPALKYSAGSKQFVAKTKISRSAFKMDSYADMVGDEIGIEIDAIVRPKH